ncbi:hypothetical protein N7495_001849 [Penicillium taxi]|uniref:uncharacterized protein n=1 Tax=Penicillium taxi TaxID=168475 RepID=UPI00254558B2|nr:uncharacterized protein N7495_001849 [Penicillium taxi]KAJ5909167.1 hypothetical protein N7495_001849 [Penicillium taxi]
MARLNDVAAPVESIEARKSIKRRFVRQNREIARVNSIQSLRIRSLESEVTHLLAENVSLREQVINLTQGMERLEAGKMLHDGIYEIKARLDKKLAEMNDLASDLGMLPRKAAKLRNRASEEFDQPKATARDPRSRPRDSEYDDGVDDGRLPSIHEDKYFPRRTLESQEIHSLVQADDSLSELALPFTENQLEVESSSPVIHDIRLETHEDDDYDPFLPPNLETRRKKNKPISGPQSEEVVPHQKPSPSVEPMLRAKLSVKRKFSPDEDGILSDMASEDDEFQFNRPLPKSLKPVSLFETIQDLSPSKTPVTMNRGSAGTMKRKVLEPKSANSNLGSPKKARASLYPDKNPSQSLRGNENMMSPQKLIGIENAKRKSTVRTRVSRTGVESQKEHREKTVGREAPSRRAPVTSDSPAAKSEDLIDISDATGASRPSRRRGAVVSYAEPNLRDKMRRPTKDLIDAVANNGSRRSSSFRESLGDENGHLALTYGSNTSDLPMTDQAINFLKTGESADQFRKSRRHSANSRSTRDISRCETDISGDSSLEASPDQAQTEGTSENDDYVWNHRETRVATRRKSMMV